MPLAIPILLSLVVELIVITELPIFGVKPPLTLLVLLMLRRWQWQSISSSLLLGGIAGYALDIASSPKPGRILLSFVLTLSAGEVLHWRLKGKRRLFKLVPAMMILLYFWLVQSSFGLKLDIVAAGQSGLFLGVSLAVGWLLGRLTLSGRRW
jgi:hypothetical protein